MTKENNPNLFLWQARKRSGLSQKAVAFLLGHKFTDDLSRYERGQRIPTLPTALKLEIIYHAPIRLLFYTAFQNSLWQIRERNERLRPGDLTPGFVRSDNVQTGHGGYCSYAEVLEAPSIPPVEKERVYEHIRTLAKKVNRVDGIEQE